MSLPKVPFPKTQTLPTPLHPTSAHTHTHTHTQIHTHGLCVCLSLSLSHLIKPMCHESAATKTTFFKLKKKYTQVIEIVQKSFLR